MIGGGTDRTLASWWYRPCGGREVLQVALPLVVSALSWTVMTFVDRMLLMWESGTAMAAAFSASMVWFVVLCLPLGICTYASTFVAQYYGSGQPERIGPATWQGVWAALLFSPAVLAAAPLAPFLFALADHGPAAFEHETRYFEILCWGGPAMLIGQALSAFYSGRGRTTVVMGVDSAAAVVNLLLDYLWIFGRGGFPAMGIAGAGWATVAALWLKAAAYLALILQRRHRAAFGTWTGMRLDRRLLGRLFYFGGPSGLQMLLDVIGFAVFVLMIGRLGSREAEATTMAFSISTLAFMPVWGFGMAAGILVGQRLGEDRDDLAARATWTTLVIAWSYMAAISILYVLVPDVFLYGFFAGGEFTPDQQAIRALAAQLLCFVAAYNLFDATLMVFVSAIKGAGDTQFLLRVTVVMAGLLAVLSWLGVEVLDFGVYGCWVLVTAWIWTEAMIFLVRFLQGKWRQMRVIDSLPPDAALAVPEPSPVQARPG